jgi:hypothetical protein
MIGEEFGPFLVHISADGVVQRVMQPRRGEGVGEEVDEAGGAPPLANEEAGTVEWARVAATVEVGMVAAVKAVARAEAAMEVAV